jgi:hypothetical protein
MRSRLVSPTMVMSRGLADGLELGEHTGRSHIVVLLRKEEFNGYYYLSLVSVLDFAFGVERMTLPQ